MWIASVPAAAAPLPGGAPAAATPAGAPADAAPFDEALAASLDAGRPAPSGGAPEPGVSRFKLVDWLLAGVAVEATPSDSTQSSTASETLVDELDAPDEADEAADELPADVLLMALQVPQQPAVEVVIVPAEVSPAQPAVAQDSDMSAGSRQDATSALSTVPTSSAPTSDLTAPAQDAPVGEIKAAEPQAAMRQDAPIKSALAHRIESEVSASVVRSAGASAPAVASSVAEGRQSAGAQAPALPVGTLEVAPERDAEVSASAGSAAGARPVTGVTLQGPMVTVGEPRATESAASAAASAAEAAPVADVVPAGDDLEREPRDAAMTMLRGVASTGPAANAQTPMGGGDARNFENDGRRSPAAQRLAAALSKAGPAVARESGDAAPGPAFSIPVQSAVTASPSQPAAAAPPAAIAVPVQAAAVPSHAAAAVMAAPATAPASVDAENVHNLVEAMRITAKAGGWEATVRLKPEHLGEVTIALRVDGKNVSAVVQAESAGVRQWLTSQEEAVRSGLSDHGLQLERFAVSRDGQRREAEQQQPQEQPRRRAPRQADAGSQPRFEVVV